MPELFDYDDGNGIYDVVTREDQERWMNQDLEIKNRKRREEATKEELADPFFDVPY